MIIYLSIFIAFVIFTFYDYKKSLLCWSTLSIAVNEGICLKYTSPNITLLFAIDLFFLLYAIYRKKITNLKDSILFPIFVFFVSSFVLSSILSSQNPVGNLVHSLGKIIYNFVLLFLLEIEIKQYKDLTSFLKLLGIFVGIASLYGLLTMLLGENPIIEFEKSLLPLDFKERIIDSSETARGLKMQSFFGGATQFAAYIMLTSLMIIAYFAKHINKKLDSKFIILLLVAVCFAFLSRTRASMFAALIVLLYFFYNSDSSSKLKITSIIILVLLLLLPFVSENLSYITSVFDASDKEKVGGSNIEMRMAQLYVVISKFSEFPILGDGPRFLIDNPNIDGLLGAESIWFQLALERGLIGILCEFFIYVYTIMSIKGNMRFYMISTMLFWFVLHTLSTTGLTNFFYLLTFLVIHKIDTTTALRFKKSIVFLKILILFNKKRISISNNKIQLQPKHQY